jgi:hypothetical protein
MAEKQTDGIAFLHNQYHRYKIGHGTLDESPMAYEQWLEQFTIVLAQKLDESLETIDTLEDECNRYSHAAEANHDCWIEATRQNHGLYGILAAVRAAALRGDLKEISRLLMVWACWN